MLSRGNMPPSETWWETGGTHSYDKILSHGNMPPPFKTWWETGGTHSYDKILSHGNIPPPFKTWWETGGTHSYDKILSQIVPYVPLRDLMGNRGTSRPTYIPMIRF